ncbi:IclR family transcriptional regulator [Streptomyces sp. SM1]|uniref:IclR family transcriptional regulator n=1 Tax=Streptomyces sp. SM1 TaxID=402229 RepID=UPI0015E1A527|nr:IclR family transcriptional regulator [Streptomyces sp. SM1]
MSSSVNRALDIIEMLSESSQGPRELSERLNVHRSTIVRLLHTLESRGYVRRLPNGKWGGGFALVATSQRTLDAIDIREVARPHLAELGSALGHTIHLATLMGHEVVYIDKVEGLGAVRMQSRVGGKANAHTAGVAKAILAFAPADIRDAAIEACTFERYSETTITTPQNLAAELERVRERGWAIDDGEAEDYINCVAVPIFGLDGAVAGGLSVTAVKSLAPLAALEAQMPRIQRARDAISAELGHDCGPNFVS